MKILAFVTPSLIGLLSVLVARLDAEEPAPAGAFERGPATVAAVGCIDCDGCTASFFDVGPSVPNLSVIEVPAVHGVDDGTCAVAGTACQGTVGCEFNDAFFITDNDPNLNFVYEIEKAEFLLQDGQNRVLVTDVERPCDQASTPNPVGNAYSVCVHTDGSVTGVQQPVWARHYLCSWCQQN